MAKAIAFKVRMILFSTFVVPLVALQNQRTTQGIFNEAKARETQTPDEGKLAPDTGVLGQAYKAFSKDRIFSHDVCSSPEYKHYLEEMHSLDKAKLKIPPNMKIFFYGTSFLHEILQEIVAVNEDTLIKSGMLGGLEGDLLDSDPASDVLTGWITKWDFTVNSTILEVQNHRGLQLPENAPNLKSFLEEHQFDVAFYMNPHPSCQFFPNDYPGDENSRGFCECFKACHAKHDCATQFDADCNPNNGGSLRGVRSDVTPLWDVLNVAMQGKVYEVEAWTTEQRTWWHADESHIIRTYPSLAGHACNQIDNCTDRWNLKGHQCQPGRIITLAEMTLDKIRDMNAHNFVKTTSYAKQEIGVSDASELKCLGNKSLCMHVYGEGDAVNHAVRMHTCTGESNQRFYFHEKALKVASDRIGQFCMDESKAALVVNGGRGIYMHHCKESDSDNQQWFFKNGTLQSAELGSEACLTLHPGNGTEVQELSMTKCDYTDPYQQFYWAARDETAEWWGHKKADCLWC